MAIVESKAKGALPSAGHAHMGAEPSTQFEMDRALEQLAARKAQWAHLPVSELLAILVQIHRDLRQIEIPWIEAGLRGKGGRPNSFVEAEEWFAISVVYRQLRFLRVALASIEKGEMPPIPGGLKMRTDGRMAAKVLPTSLLERAALPGIRGEVWFAPGVEPTRAANYKKEARDGRLCVVLAAGNVASLVPGDFLHKLFVERQVVAVKTNPVNAYLGPLFEEGFQALVRSGYLRFLSGGEREGGYLAQHPEVEELHITGSDSSYEAVVFGKGVEGARRKRERNPLNTRPFTAELGNLSPVIVVPGPWSDRDIRIQARKMGSWLVPNAGHNCNTPRVFIQHKDWPQRAVLNNALAEFLATIEPRKAYYPHSFEGHATFVQEHPEALQIGEASDGQLPWTLIPDVDSNNLKDICFNREPFFSLYSETALEATDTVDFIEKAVAFANNHLWGTLSASIVVHPKSMRDSRVAAAVDRAVADLHYGSVVINHWGALAYYAAVTPWGGAPGHDMYDIQSGTGWVHNPLMFDNPEKSVIYAPFVQMPDPYAVDLERNYLYFRRDTRFQANPTLPNLLRLLWAAVRS